MDKFTDRDKLIELIKQATTSHLDYLESIDQKGLTDTEGRAKFIAEHLLANGVIVPVRCKDCKYCELRYPAKAIGEEAIEGYYCFANKRYLKSTDFCSCGELKELEGNEL